MSGTRTRILTLACVLLAAGCGSATAPSARPRSDAKRPDIGEGVSLGERLARAQRDRDWQAALAVMAESGDSEAYGPLADSVVDRASQSDLEAVAAALPQGRFPMDRVNLRLGLLHEHSGLAAAAREAYARVRGPLQSTADQRIASLSHRARGHRVAVLLPLSGQYAAIGREARAAIELFAAGHDGFDPVFLDTAGDAETAARRVDEAVIKEGAIAIIGPVGDHESRAAAARAATHSVAIALLGPGASQPSEGIFRLASSPVWEAKAAAKTAKLLGFKSVAVLAPRDEHGEAAAATFARVASALGVRVLADGRYDPTATDLEPDLKSFFGLDPARNARLRRHLRRYGRKNGWKSFSPDINFELLYVPDSHRRASLVASYLPYFNIEVRTRDLMNTYSLRRKHGGRLPSVVQLMGSSSWHHPALIPAGGRAIDGAFVLDIFVGGVTEDFVYEEAAVFSAAYEKRTGRPPSRFAAQSHDAAALVAEALSRVRHGGREGVARALSRARISAGVCGPARMGPDRIIERQAVVLRVEAGEFVLHDY